MAPVRAKVRGTCDVPLEVARDRLARRHGSGSGTAITVWSSRVAVVGRDEAPVGGQVDGRRRRRRSRRIAVTSVQPQSPRSSAASGRAAGRRASPRAATWSGRSSRRCSRGGSGAPRRRSAVMFRQVSDSRPVSMRPARVEAHVDRVVRVARRQRGALLLRLPDAVKIGTEQRDGQSHDDEHTPRSWTLRCLPHPMRGNPSIPRSHLTAAARRP